jgi:hypothetical protein
MHPDLASPVHGIIESHLRRAVSMANHLQGAKQLDKQQDVTQAVVGCVRGVAVCLVGRKSRSSGKL